MRFPRILTAMLTAILLLASAGSTTARADDEAAPEMTPEQLRKEYERLPYERFYRHGSHLYDQVIRFSQADQENMNLRDQFLQAYYQGRWDEVRRVLELLPDDLARSSYDKILADLTDRYTPILTLDDFIGLCDACPTDLDSTRIRRLGLLLRVAVAPEQESWLRKRLQQGTRFLGADDDKRITTGRMLIHADFDELAKEYVPDAVAVTQLTDGSARSEISGFWKSQEQIDEFQETRIASLWEERARVLSNPNASSNDQRIAAERLAELFGKAPAHVLEPFLAKLMDDRMAGALELASHFGKYASYQSLSSEVDTRVRDLQAQTLFLRLAAERTKLTDPAWNAVALAMADWWIKEAEHTFDNAPSYRTVRSPKPYVPSAELMDTAPQGAWRDALPPSLQERIDVRLSRAVLVSNRYEEAVPMIARLAKGAPDSGVRLAEEYLQAWAHRHDPHVPEEVRRKLNLPSEARIVVTPIMLEKNIDDLAAMMAIFREHGITPRNSEALVDAFDVCYSNAEVYRRGHIEKVFGSVDAVDEALLHQMLLTMTEGLGTRWRSLDVQVQAGTRRTEAETLEMVRQGYETALALIDERVAVRPDSWRLLSLGGSLLSDWGDFEYYQQLVADAGVDRVERYQERNKKAAEYFRRAADAYAKRVGDLAPRDYSIEPYLAWFHALLGVGVNGQMNVSKPLDRRALNEIRECVRSLPEDVAAAHVDRFAKHVAARMEDVNEPLHEDLKYKYLAGSLVITRDSPFSFQATDKVAYYDELLDEIHLETRVDGPNTIHRDQDFGILLTVRHTEAMGRMADFGKYLVNDLVPRNAPSVQSKLQGPATVYRMGDMQGPRDELEMNIREALSLFFDVRTVVFSPRDVQPRATAEPGWQETVLAYIQCRAKDASVDKIPRIQMSLEFLDLTGPVTIAAESPETMIKVTDQPSAPRPFDDVDINVIFDQRQLISAEEITLEVKATGAGLMPELEDLLDLDELATQLPIARVQSNEGVVLKSVNSWGEHIHALSERTWTVALDASSLVDPPQRIEFQMPRPIRDDEAIVYQAYHDMDLINLEETRFVVGLGSAAVKQPTLNDAPLPHWNYLAGIGAACLLAALCFASIAALWRRERPIRARDVFHVPDPIDGFTVVKLLRALDQSPLVRLNDSKRSELHGDIDRVEASCFNTNGAALSDDELRDLARRWLRSAC